jgi:alcohol dehydrogenase class IV
MTGVDLSEETIFTWGAPPLKFGAGASDEVGFEMSGYGVRRVLIVTDVGLHALGVPERIADNLRRYDIESSVGSTSRRSSTACTSSPPTTR